MGKPTEPQISRCYPRQLRHGAYRRTIRHGCSPTPEMHAAHPWGSSNAFGRDDIQFERVFIKPFVSSAGEGMESTNDSGEERGRGSDLACSRTATRSGSLSSRWISRRTWSWEGSLTGVPESFDKRAATCCISECSWMAVFSFLVGRARSPESDGLSSPGTRRDGDTIPLPWSTADPALNLL
jgi:hypothetical protein